MHRFNIIAVVLIIEVFFFSCSVDKIQMIGANYEFGKDSFSIEILYENQTDSVLIFPNVFTNCLLSISEGENAIVIDECNMDFKNLAQMVDLQLRGVLMDEKDSETDLRLVPVYPGRKFICSNTIPYSKIPKQVIRDKGQIEIRIDYGKAKSIEYTGLEKIIAKGTMEEYCETIPLDSDIRKDLGELPYPGLFPICDLDGCIYFEKSLGIFEKHD